MSRVGKKIIPIPSRVDVEVMDGLVRVRGPLGELSCVIPSILSVVVEEGILKIISANEDKRTRCQAGTLRANLYNQVKGVSEGFTSTLTLVKVGANAQIDGDYLVLKIGYSNPKRYPIREEVKITTPSATEIVIQGINIQQVNQVAADIIKIRPPEVYKGTGILRKGQRIKLKAAKKK